MNIIGVQLILIFFALVMIYKHFLHWKKNEISKLTYYFWIISWIGLITITVFPRFFERLLIKPFFVRVMDFGMVGAFMVLTYLTYENNVRIKKYDKQLEKLVRKLAIKNCKR